MLGNTKIHAKAEGNAEIDGERWSDGNKINNERQEQYIKVWEGPACERSLHKRNMDVAFSEIHVSVIKPIIQKQILVVLHPGAPDSVETFLSW